MDQISQVTENFRQSMQDAGIYYSGEIVADGKLHRIRSENHKIGTQNCAYVLHIDGGKPAGYFENWVASTKHTWTTRKLTRGFHAFSHKEITEAKLQRDIEQRQKHAAAAIKAVNIWNRCKPITKQSEHLYLVNKRIQPHGARIYGDALVIPIYNESDELVNLQFISLNGEKRFLSGGRKRGCFHIISDLSQCILICEGFATGASLFEDSGQRVVIAFDAGNLLPVAKNIRDLSPDTEIIICADNDLSGVGQAKAREAALSIGGKILIPLESGMDWNDVLTGGCHE
ncbi:toprim domain-containing protein [Nitrosomonas sp.]|uniref:toprim domain-containing protein n=1 Tax=Nitrosomonas sp. TaxID=42353 RepID=UPI00374DBFE3